MNDITLKVNYDVADAITRANLVDMLDTCEHEEQSIIAKLAAEGKLEDHHKVDLVDAALMKVHLEAVIKHISTRSDLEEYGLEHLFDE